MMAWFFLKKNREMLSHLVAALMIIVALQCIKDLFFLTSDTDTYNDLWMIMTSSDMIAVPLYAFILIELCRPGTLTMRTIVIHEIPFILCPLLFILTRNVIFYYVDVAWAAIYGFSYAVWTVIAIPKYHRLLKQRFSYEENINLNWLRNILFSFFAILSLWIVDCLVIDFDIEAVYMMGSLIIWMFICYFIYRHESVIDELNEPIITDESAAGIDDNTPGLKELILNLFENEQIYLNPQLKLSDVAAMTKSNRTYVSRFFNNSHGKTFFEFVNEYRVRHAMALLKSSNEKLDVIAEQSGFSSRQSFHRVFIKIAGCSPGQYRGSTPPHKYLITNHFYDMLHVVIPFITVNKPILLPM